MKISLAQMIHPNPQLFDTVMGPKFLKYFVISSARHLQKLQLFHQCHLSPQNWFGNYYLFPPLQIPLKISKCHLNKTQSLMIYLFIRNLTCQQIIIQLLSDDVAATFEAYQSLLFGKSLSLAACYHCTTHSSSQQRLVKTVLDRPDSTDLY